MIFNIYFNVQTSKDILYLNNSKINNRLKYYGTYSINL